MPPKKIVDKTSTSAKITNEQNQPQNKRRGRKPKVNTPTVIKVKIKPPAKTLLMSCKKPEIPDSKGNQSPKISPGAKRKIDLANEVALAQLTNSKIEDIPPPAKKVKKEEKVPNVSKKKKITKSKSIKKNGDITTKTPSTEDPSTRKVPKQKMQLKKGRSKKSDEKIDTKTEAKSNAASKRKADSTSKPEATRKSSRIKTNVNETQLETCPDQSTNKGKPKELDGVSTTGHQQSPSILQEASKLLKDDETMKNKVENEPSTPGQIDSRKTSTSECLSWTRDISLSSTTTCLTVGSNDIVRFDKKFPVVKLSNIDKEWNKIQERRAQSDSSDSESDGESSSSSSSCSSRLSTSLSRSLNLSSPSLPPDNTHQTNEDNVSDTKAMHWNILQQISSVLEKFDLEFASWVGYENQNIETRTDPGTYQEIIKMLSVELEMLTDFKYIGSNLGRCKKVTNNRVGNEESVNKITQNNVDVNNYVDKSEEDDNFTSVRSKYVMLNQSCEGEQDSLQPPPDQRSPSVEIFHLERDRYTSFDEPYIDDDDALSLFAESIDIESSKFNSSANSMCANASEYEHEEYIPQPMVPREKHPETSYIPTKITDTNDQTGQNSKTKIICEKQNADSTSIHKESESHSAQAMERIVSEHNRPIQNTGLQTATCSLNITIPPAAFTKKPPLLVSTLHKPTAGVKSVVFRGVCFFNLISNCKKSRCVFPHVYLDKLEVSNRLSALTNEMFIQEYMLLRSWPDIRRVYGFCYVAECIRRTLTEVLLEMVIDFICKEKLDSTDDAELKVYVVERTLLYLNDVDLSTCDDLLQYEFYPGVLLCDVFMQNIAETQNFSRFKAVFIKLTDFITKIGRAFQLDVASHILERVCILPCEEQLVLAVMKMIRKTDAKIFENSMMTSFEKHLTGLDGALYDELHSLRQQAFVARVEAAANTARSPQLNKEEEPLVLMRPLRDERYTSPDTTKIDNANKPSNPPLTQTVKIVRPSIFNHLFKSKSNPNSPMARERVIMGSPTRSWRGHNNFVTPNMPRFRPPRQLLKRHMDQVAFGPTPPKFLRKAGPDFF